MIVIWVVGAMAIIVMATNILSPFTNEEIGSGKLNIPKRHRVPYHTKTESKTLCTVDFNEIPNWVKWKKKAEPVQGLIVWIPHGALRWSGDQQEATWFRSGVGGFFIRGLGWLLLDQGLSWHPKTQGSDYQSGRLSSISSMLGHPRLSNLMETRYAPESQGAW